jgi:predicted TIM-barrel fold metal-dependent hydrolase
MRCDCHVHLVGPPDCYPQVPTRTYLAGVARLEDLERNGRPHGISRSVIVQVSIYGTDNDRAIIDRLNQEVNKALQAPDVIDRAPGQPGRQRDRRRSAGGFRQGRPGGYRPLHQADQRCGREAGISRQSFITSEETTP